MTAIEHGFGTVSLKLGLPGTKLQRLILMMRAVLKLFLRLRYRILCLRFRILRLRIRLCVRVLHLCFHMIRLRLLGVSLVHLLLRRSQNRLKRWRQTQVYALGLNTKNL